MHCFCACGCDTGSCHSLLKRLSRVCTCVVLGQPDAPQQRNAPCVYVPLHQLSTKKKAPHPEGCDAGEVHLTTEDEARVAMFVVPHTLNVEYGFRYVGVMLIIGVTKVPHIVAISRDE